MKFLICSIVRNRVTHLNRWIEQIKSVIEKMPEHEFSLAVYENDSQDGTKEWFGDLFSFENLFNQVVVEMEDLLTPEFGSVKDSNRVQLLAEARNKCLDLIDIKDYDKVVWIEPDVSYNPEQIVDLLLKSTDWDIISGTTYLPNSSVIYDSWATRLNQGDRHWRGHNELADIRDKEIFPLWATFNGVCVYSAQGFVDGAIFEGWFNGYYECDTTVICENFRKLGYDKIALMPNVEIVHP